MNHLKYLLLVVVLVVVIIFLLLDSCGSSRRADELRGQHEEASQIAEVERRIKEETIREQNKKIEEQDLLIAEANREVEIKNDHISSLGNTVAELEEEFDNLTDKDAKINNLTKQIEAWRDKFNLSQSIISDKDAIIFSLTQKYKSQVVISDSYKTMYDTLTLNTKKLQLIVTAQDWQIKKLRLTSGLKSGFVVVLAGLIVYNMVK